MRFACLSYLPLARSNKDVAFLLLDPFGASRGPVGAEGAIVSGDLMSGSWAATRSRTRCLVGTSAWSGFESRGSVPYSLCLSSVLCRTWVSKLHVSHLRVTPDENHYSGVLAASNRVSPNTRAHLYWRLYSSKPPVISVYSSTIDRPGRSV